ncbi:MAG: T9SS type A sorting domain-containing protein [Bacteroidales bacterium]|nr:T9SS type A sorting domain-containing protein [Bacteroidales bacterium]
MKNKITILLLMVALSLSHISYSQQTLISELPINRNDEILSEIGSRAEVLLVLPIAIEKNILFFEDTLFKIELSENVFYIAKKYVNHRDINSFSFYGISGTNSLVLSFLDNDIQGVLTINNHPYSIETHQGKNYLVQLDNSLFQENCEDLECSNNPSQNDSVFQENKEANGGIIPTYLLRNRFHDVNGDIKVMVLYTANAANSVSNIVNTSLLAEELSNQSFINSGIDCKIELVYIGKTDYEESSSSTDVTRFKNTDEGYIDEVHLLREKYAADVCVLLTDYDDLTCGRAYTIKARKTEAFCVVQAYYCSTTNYSFIHEIGHLMGCRHDCGMDNSTSPYEYGHGYINPDKTWRTIMAYGTYCNDCDRIQYWSNPYITYNGETMGTTERCNNAKVWNIRYGEVGAFEVISSNATITSATIPSSLNYGFIETDSHIGTNGIISLNSGQSLTIKAGDEIVFSDGFEVLAGSELKAFIAQQPATSYATAPLPTSIEVTPVRHFDTTEIKKTVIVYPNPTTDELYIQNSGEEYPIQIIILDVMGKIVNNINYPVSSIDLSNLPAGTYFIKIEFTNRSERYRIIKK